MKVAPPEGGATWEEMLLDLRDIRATVTIQGKDCEVRISTAALTLRTIDPPMPVPTFASPIVYYQEPVTEAWMEIERDESGHLFTIHTDESATT